MNTFDVMISISLRYPYILMRCFNFGSNSTENKRSSIWLHYGHWWHRKLSLRQLVLLTMKSKLSNWRPFVFGVMIHSILFPGGKTTYLWPKPTPHGISLWGNAKTHTFFAKLELVDSKCFDRSVSSRDHYLTTTGAVVMMTSSNGNIFRVTGHLCGKFTGPRWISRTKASDAELWCFLWFTPE